MERWPHWFYLLVSKPPYPWPVSKHAKSRSNQCIHQSIQYVAEPNHGSPLFYTHVPSLPDEAVKAGGHLRIWRRQRRSIQQDLNEYHTRPSDPRQAIGVTVLSSRLRFRG